MILRRLWFLLRARTLDWRERRIVRRALSMDRPSPPELPSGRHWTEVWKGDPVDVNIGPIGG